MATRGHCSPRVHVTRQ